MTSEPTVSLGFGEYTDTDSKRQGIRIEVKNVGDEAIDEIKVEWVYDYDAPQEATQEFSKLHGDDFARSTGQKPVKVHEVGRRYSFSPAKGESDGPLAPGGSRVFLYPPDWISEMVSVVQSLSPERYRVAITMNGKEEEAIPGKDFGDFVQGRFGTSETPHDDLSEDRMQLIANLVGRIVQLGQGFKIFPPPEVTSNPGVLASDDAVTRLAETKWWLRFADEREELLSFTELMILTYNLIMVKLQLQEAQRQANPVGEAKISVTFAVPQIMTPEGVKTLLSKLNLEGIE